MKTILVVDDDPGIRALLKTVVASMGYAVREAGDAITALEVLEGEKVALALVDIRMPGRDGVWLVDQIIARFPGTPIALATGLAEMDPHVTLRAGVIGYIVKPFSRAAIADVIRAALESRPQAQRGEIDIAALDAMS